MSTIFFNNNTNQINSNSISINKFNSPSQHLYNLSSFNQDKLNDNNDEIISNNSIIKKAENYQKLKEEIISLEKTVRQLQKSRRDKQSKIEDLRGLLCRIASEDCYVSISSKDNLINSVSNKEIGNYSNRETKSIPKKQFVENGKDIEIISVNSNAENNNITTTEDEEGGSEGEPKGIQDSDDNAARKCSSSNCCNFTMCSMHWHSHLLSSLPSSHPHHPSS